MRNTVATPAITPDQIDASNARLEAEAVRDYAHLGEQLARRGVDIEDILAEVMAFSVAVPSWGMGTGGMFGSGRSSLLKQAMHEVAASKRVPPDLCYLHNFDAPERPLALRLPAGEGRLLRQLLANAVKALQDEIPQRLEGQDYKAESERIEQAWKADIAGHYAALT
ncbi:MAG: hypothetical protein B7Z26_01945, partial [Asticcacaulis sp. 32-58-5]